MNKKTLILGGDNRSLYLGEYLERNKLDVCYYAFKDVECFKTLKEAVAASEIIMLPLPFTRDRECVNTPLFDEKIQIKELSALLDSEKHVFGGQLTQSFTEELDLKNIFYCDYFKLPELSVYNAVPTAEGVTELLIRELPVTVHSSSCAVLGYGKVGKAICRALQALGANVFAVTRSPLSAAEAASALINTCSFESLKTRENTFDAVINTVPAPVFGNDEMKTLNTDCLLIEVASPPYGIDQKAARANALTLIKAPSLPGRVAPKTAGEIIGKTVLPILYRKGLIA